MKVRSLGLGVLISLTGLATPAAAQTPLTWWGDEVYLQLASTSAAWDNDLYFAVFAGPDAFLFDNRTTPVGYEMSFNPGMYGYMPGQELVFMIEVYIDGTTGPEEAQYNWYTNSALNTRTALGVTTPWDVGVSHVQQTTGDYGTVTLDPSRAYALQMGWEDLPQYLWGSEEWSVDEPDFNDIIVRASITTPEPVSIALLGTGLLGLAVLGRRRRKILAE